MPNILFNTVNTILDKTIIKNHVSSSEIEHKYYVVYTNFSYTYKLYKFACHLLYSLEKSSSECVKNKQHKTLFVNKCLIVFMHFCALIPKFAV